MVSPHSLSKLKTVVDSIETSPKLSPEQREQVYQAIYKQMQNLVVPVLLKNTPASQIEAFTGKDPREVIERYGELVVDALNDQSIRSDLTHALDMLFGEIDRIIKAELV